MNGQELIKKLISEEMPDLEKARELCHRQNTPQTQHGYKTGTRLRLRAALITAAACLIFATVVYAVYTVHIGSFDRLRDVIGDERADLLTPMGAEVVREFSRSGFRGELVAIGIFSNALDLYLTLEDTTGNRLDGEFTVFANVWHGQDISLTMFSEIIDRTPCGVVTLHSREVFAEPITEQKLTFALRYIHYNYRSAELEIDFDLSGATEQTPAAWLWDTPLLPAHMHDIPVALAGFGNAGRIRISSIGIIGGRLHIQEYYDSAALNRWTGNKVRLIAPDGTEVRPLHGTRENTASVSFRIDGDYFYNDRGYNFIVDFPYRENIFAVDTERLADYRLVAYFDTHDHRVLNWIATFEIDAPHGTELAADGLKIYLECGSVITGVRVSPLSLLLEGRLLRNEDGFMLIPENLCVRLHTSDGASFNASRGWARINYATGEFTEFMLIEAEILDVETITAVEIFGEMITLR